MAALHTPEVERTTVRSKAKCTIGLAIAGGFLGVVVGTLEGFSLQGSFLGDNDQAATVGALGGGIGWFVGLCVGLLVAKGAPPPDRALAWALRGAAGVVVLLGLIVALWVPSLDRNPHDPPILQLQRVILLDSVLAAVTLLVVAQGRTPPGRTPPG